MGREAGERVVRACAMFGLVPGVVRAGEGERARRAAAALDGALRGGQVALVTGASGGGKTSMVRALGERVRSRGEEVVVVDPRGLRLGTAVIEQLRGGVEGALRSLARAGLAEARLLSLPAGVLSEGERWRLALARAVHGVEREHRFDPKTGQTGGTVTVIADEFGSTLDRVTARGVARAVRRWVWGTPGVRVVCATGHADLERALAPDVVVEQPLEGEAAVRNARPSPQSRRRPWHPRIVRGTIADYDGLARFHYRAGRPATCVQVLRAMAAGETVGVLVVSMPTLNGAWRELAWPGRYSSGDRRADARRLSAEVRTISRVVVDPRWRGTGLGSRLVRAYLRRPLTAATEAVAAMGACCPVFGRAGMTEYRMGPTRRDARLADALAACGACGLDLLRKEKRARLVRLGLVRRELRVWAEGGGGDPDSRAGECGGAGGEGGDGAGGGSGGVCACEGVRDGEKRREER